ncbi:hypothetical protein BDV38DRAFT_282655 [Aspergillus pseudotamarii]|uniref:Uncharacterized protein n=1 Tax=Aspergillus pseudotamarii TaxID=132259 RepID=A0A5N6SVF3_ASPPS|nr:uncharacterized protein BDV38DRAFT_282655 [Aspergillus pseudotamarii]KAE8137720.1 hypothetical protein BDV38DRAFT_282655 [Aspergillus pseudotamarii]
MAYLRPGIKSDATCIIVRNRVNPERNAIFKLYSFITIWGAGTMYGSINYSSWKGALTSQCGFSSWCHRIRCRLSLGKGTQEFVYICSEKQFAAAIDLMSKDGADLEFEIVHKYKWLRVKKYGRDGASHKYASDFYDAVENQECFERCDLD